MILGISSYTYGWSVGIAENMPQKPMNELDLLEEAAKFELGCLQIGDNLPLHEVSADRLKALRTSALDKGVRLEIGARKLTYDNVFLYTQLASFLNAPLLRFVIDDVNYHPDVAATTSILKRVKPLLEEKHIVLGIENHDRLKSRNLAAMIADADSEQIGVCLDCANSLGAGEGLEHVANVLAPFTVNLHIKDYSIARLPHKMGFIVEGARYGKGLLDLNLLQDKLNLYGRCQSAILEQWVPPHKNLEETIKQEKSWAEEAISQLRKENIFKVNNLIKK